jgi:hypothetical protein
METGLLIAICIHFLPVSFKCRKHSRRSVRKYLPVKTRSQVDLKVRVLIHHCVFWNRPLLGGGVMKPLTLMEIVGAGVLDLELCVGSPDKVLSLTGRFGSQWWHNLTYSSAVYLERLKPRNYSVKVVSLQMFEMGAARIHDGIITFHMEQRFWLRAWRREF